MTTSGIGEPTDQAMPIGKRFMRRWGGTLFNAFLLYIFVSSIADRLDRPPSGQRTFFIWLNVAGLMLLAASVAVDISKSRAKGQAKDP